MKTSTEKFTVVFDGTSYFICPEDEITSEMEIIGEYFSVDYANRICEKLNN